MDTEFNASSKTGSARRPILRLIGLCYVDSTYHMVMISVDLKVISRMTPYNASRVTTQLRGLFIRGEGRMAAFDFSQDRLALERAGVLQGNAQGPLVHNLKPDPVIMARCNSTDRSAAAGTPLG